jgi:hypothetical protein
MEVFLIISVFIIMRPSLHTCLQHDKRIGFHCVSILILFFLLSNASFSTNNYLIIWNVNQEPDIAGYEVHWGKISQEYGYHFDAGLNTDYFVSEMPDTGLYYFAITAYDSSWNKSTYSEEVSIMIETPMTTVTGSPFNLLNSYPNPFNPETNILFTVSKTTHVTLTVHDVIGRYVKVLMSEEKLPGCYQVKWDGTDQSGDVVANGIYFSRLSIDHYHQSRKLILIR